MSTLIPSRRWFEKQARRFGIHVATHQIRLILISAVVITSLFYPALALYSRSTHKGVLDSFLAARLNSQAGSLRNVLAARVTVKRDLLNIWDPAPELKVVEDTVIKARHCERKGVQIERLLIQTPDADAVNDNILHQTLKLETAIAQHLDRYPPILTLSPLSFWNHDIEALNRDENIFDTLGTNRNTSVRGINVSPEMVLAGRGKDGFATFLAVTYAFQLDENDPCPSETVHKWWLDIVRNSTGEFGHVGPGVEEPTFITLQYNKKGLTRSPVTDVMLYIAYIGFSIYIAIAVRVMDAVHSRVGLLFTVVVEMIVSTIGSLSICALVGFRVDRVPWAMLSAVIIGVGAENTFSLVDAVVHTHVTLAVKDRVAFGLQRAGVANTCKLVSYNAFLGTIAFWVSDETVRQFCVFAMVVLVAHWFLAHTFFLAVLSIDLQRLDLHEVLRQNQAGNPKTPISASDKTVSWRKWYNLMSGHAIKNISFVMLVLITSTLYYTTYTHPPDLSVFQQSAALSRTPPKLSFPLGRDVASYEIWKVLNPVSTAPVQIRLESPTIVTFGSERNEGRRRYRWLPLRDLHPVIWLIKIVSLQIAVTTALLYGLCRYLLKDADTVAAMRDKLDPVDSDSLSNVSDNDRDVNVEFASKSKFEAFPRALRSDIELIASSKEGKIGAAVTVTNEFVIWDTEHKLHHRVSTQELLSVNASTSTDRQNIVALDVDNSGRWVAVGTTGGLVAVWIIQKGGISQLAKLPRIDLNAGVKEVLFVKPRNNQPSLLVIYDNNQAAKWRLDDEPAFTMITPSQTGVVLQCLPVKLPDEDLLLVCHSMVDGTLDVIEISKSGERKDSAPFQLLAAGRPSDPVVSVHAARTTLNGVEQLLVAAVTHAGYVSVWDVLTGESVVYLDDAYGPVSSIKILQMADKTCSKCDELMPESFVLALSIANAVITYNVLIPSRTRLCVCSSGAIPRMASFTDLSAAGRSRSGSKTSTNGASTFLAAPPSRARLRVPSSFELANFPISAHGIHSRKVERRGSDIGQSNGIALSPISTKAPARSTKSTWENVTIVPLCEAPCDRGSWTVWDNKLFGIRRCSRPLHKRRTEPLNASRLTAAALERWELWSFNPSELQLKSTQLSTIDKGTLATDLFPRLPFTRISPFVVSKESGYIGMGNAIGRLTIVSS